MRNPSFALALILCACTTTKIEYRTVYDTTIVYVPDIEYVPVEKDMTESDTVELGTCSQPTPLTCGDQCCPEYYSCTCQNSKVHGICLPGGTTLCDCNDTEPFCNPLEACIKDKNCREKGFKCKPLGAGGVENEDCPEALNCYCDPGFTCTHKEPACCALATPIPCKDHCCSAENECLPKNIDDGCLAPDEEYCGKIIPGCNIVCKAGEQCRTKSCGCKPDDTIECPDGMMCPVDTPACVGNGNGLKGSSCCPSIQPIGCGGFCCPTQTHCSIFASSGGSKGKICGGCVENGYKCCVNGQFTCLEKKICWSNGVEKNCLDDEKQDCVSYACPVAHVCSSGPQKCCPATNPKTCGKNCCLSFEECLGGMCVNIQAGVEFCGTYTCAAGLTCMKNKEGACMPDGATDCGDGCYCNSKETCYKVSGKWKCGSKNITCQNCCCLDNYECVSNSPGIYKYIPQKYCCIKNSPKPPCPNPGGGCKACYPENATDPIGLADLPNAVCK